MPTLMVPLAKQTKANPKLVSFITNGMNEACHSSVSGIEVRTSHL